MRPVYPILDVEAAGAGGHDLVACARGFAALGLDIQQLRAKRIVDREFLALADRLRGVVPRLIINDRADIALLCGAAGVHVGQEDMPVDEVRTLGREWMIGVSTHTVEQARVALERKPDYLAVGPVYPTNSKERPDPVVGADMVRRARALTSLPLVAIGGIQIGHCEEVWRAGADAVAVISGLWARADPVGAAGDFLLAFERFSCHSPQESKTPGLSPHGH